MADDDFTKELWGNRAEGLPVPGFDPSREITPQEIANLEQRYAFVQIMNPKSGYEPVELRSVKSRSGWIILNYGNAMATSPGEALFSNDIYKTTETGELERLCTGKGTRIKQIVDTAADMVSMAEEQKWTGIQIINGQEDMCWAIWAAAQALQMEVIGYVPSKAREKQYQRIMTALSSLVTPKPATP